jgi:hypothetical protein
MVFGGFYENVAIAEAQDVRENHLWQESAVLGS